VDYVSRAAWGGSNPEKTPTRLVPGSQRGIAVHYEGRDSEGQGHDACDERVRAIQRFHMRDRGWNDIAYSWLVCRHGVIFEGRGWGIRTAANGTNEGNATFHAVCYLDDDAAAVQDVTPEGYSGLTSVIAECRSKGLGSEVKPHSYFKATACPGNELRAWVAAGGYNAPPPVPAPPPPPRPAPSTPGWYRRMLQHVRPNMRGDDVKVVQRKVRTTADGIFGPNTEKKVRGYQAAHGLAVDGIVGPKTATHMGE
jgi:peptidoglycan hydrolase-like protein with peptidoglycan-binding domain